MQVEQYKEKECINICSWVNTDLHVALRRSAALVQVCVNIQQVYI